MMAATAARAQSVILVVVAAAVVQAKPLPVAMDNQDQVQLVALVEQFSPDRVVVMVEPIQELEMTVLGVPVVAVVLVVAVLVVMVVAAR